LFDVGGTYIEKHNGLTGADTTLQHPNIGFEQALPGDRFTVRFGLDETSPVAGFSYKFKPFKLDFVYVRDMARARVGELFGTHSTSFVVTLSVDYGAFMGKR
jgi:hypothetical protein